MMTEHTISRDSINSLDYINNAIIQNTFLSEPDTHVDIKETKETKTKETKETKEKEEEPEKTEKLDCCSDRCFKWWFFHSSFQAPSKSIIEEDLLQNTKKYSCFNLCGDCIEVKLKNYCVTVKSENCKECFKEYCSDCFYNGCQLSCCCFTFILSTK